MEKIIIENRSSLPLLIVMECVKEVIKLGRISNNNTQYCYCISFTSINVITDKNKMSDRFIAIDRRK